MPNNAWGAVKQVLLTRQVSAQNKHFKTKETRKRHIPRSSDIDESKSATKTSKIQIDAKIISNKPQHCCSQDER